MKHTWLFLLAFLAACGGETQDPTAVASAEADALEFERSDAYRATPRTPLVEIERWNPGTPEVRLAPLGTTRCGELDVHELSDPRRRQPNGNYQIAGVTPSGRHFSEVCPQSLETLTQGPEVTAKFTASVSGRYTFEATGATHLYALDSCDTEAEPTECASIPHYHARDFFSAPRRIFMQLEAGQTVYLVLDSMNATTMSITAHTPFEEGQYCVVNTNGWIQRACGPDLWCDSGNEVREERVCRPRHAPRVSGAWVGITGDTIHLTAHGVDDDANVRGMLVELLDARNQPIAVSGDRTQVSVRVVPGDELGERRWVLRGVADRLNADALAGAASARLVATDGTGAASEPYDAELSVRESLSETEYCDALRIRNHCAPGLACLEAGPAAWRCTTWTATAFQSDNALIVEATGQASDIDPTSLFVWFPEEDYTRTLSVHAREPRDRRANWHAKQAWTLDPVPAHVTMAPGHRYGGKDASVAVELQPLPTVELGERCDGDRVADRCNEGLACLQGRDGFHCWEITAPEITEARVFQQRGAMGVEVEGLDVDSDVVAVRVTAVAEGARPFERAFLTQWGDEHGALEIHRTTFRGNYSFRYYARATEFDVVVIDAEGLESAPVRATVSERRDAVEFEACDLLEARALCPEDTFCDRRDGEAEYVCQTATHACPDAWEVTELQAGRGGQVTVAGNTLGAPNHTTSSCTSEMGWVDAPERVFSFTAPQRGWYQMWVTSDAFELFDVSIRRHCTHPRQGHSELACTDDADWHQAYGQTGTDLEEGEEVFVFVERADADATGAFELTVSW